MRIKNKLNIQPTIQKFSIPETEPKQVEEVKEIKVEEVLQKVTANTNVFYRKEPSTGSETLGIIDSGREVEVVAETENWYKLKDLGWSMKCFYN